MKITVMTSTGDDDLINEEEKGDLEYRREQLKRLQNEVVDIEDMNSGISIMDLGLNEFRLDLMDYVRCCEAHRRTPERRDICSEKQKQLRQHRQQKPHSSVLYGLCQ